MADVKQKLADRVAADIQHMIFNEYKPGDKLPVENDLARHCSVSRVTIREAVSKLSAMGVVDVRQGEGTFVTQLTPSSFMRPMLPMLSMSKVDLEEIFEVRILIETYAVEVCATRATEEDLIELQAFLKKMDSALLAGNITEYNEYDVQFHNELVRCSHNQVLSVIIELLVDMIKESIFFCCSQPEQVLNSVILHNRIYRAIAEHDPVEASKLMREHLDRALRFVKENKTAENNAHERKDNNSQAQGGALIR